MSNERIGRHIFLAFLLALAFYIGAFSWIEHRRHRNGPWQITFRSDALGQPSLEINHAKLNVSNVVFSFDEERLAQTNLAQAVIFDRPVTNVPFGKVIFLDTTFLPGTVTLDLFGHEIELLPRTLVVNLKEVPWQSSRTFSLKESDKPSQKEGSNAPGLGRTETQRQGEAARQGEP